MKPVLETKRLILRELDMMDDIGMFELDSDADVHKYLGNNPVKTIEESRQVIAMIQQQYKEHGIGRWAMIEKSSNDFIGWAGLKFITEPINNHVHYYDLGYRLIKRYWGKGFATEAAQASLNYGFTVLNQDSIYGIAITEHAASIHVLQKVGLTAVENFMYENLPHVWLRADKKKLT